MKKINVLLLLFMSIFLSGCFTIDINQEINEDGTSKIEILYDISSLLESASGLEAEFGENFETNVSQEDSFCKDFIEEHSSKNLDCNVIREGVYQVTGEIDISENLEVKSSLFSKEYIFDAVSIFTFLETLENENDEGITQSGLGELKILNPTLTYTINMPAEIVSAEVGTISQTRVLINLFDLENKEQALVVAKGKNSFLIILFFIFLFFICLGAGFYFFKKNSLKKNTLKKEEFLSVEENKAKTYICQYKASYSREDIKQGLITNGISVENSENYLSKYY